MQQWLLQQFSDPLHLIGSVLAIGAGISILIFLYGSLAYFFSRGNDDEKQVGNVLTVWSTTWLVILFLSWEGVRWLAHLISKA